MGHAALKIFETVVDNLHKISTRFNLTATIFANFSEGCPQTQEKYASHATQAILQVILSIIDKSLSPPIFYSFLRLCKANGITT